MKSHADHHQRQQGPTRSLTASEHSVVDDGRLACALEEFLTRRDAGQILSREAFLAEYPTEIREPLALALDSLDFIGGCTPHLEQGVTSDPSLLLSEPTPSFCLGDFRILREIGRGGMGVVYEAEQISLQRRVALKVLPFLAVLDANQLRRFKNEALAAGGLEHPHIVPVYAVGCDRGVHYFAMRLIQGQTLAEVIARRVPSRMPHGATPPVAADESAAVVPAVAETLPVAALTTRHSPDRFDDYHRVADWGLQAADALQHAHDAGLVHRDIKPSNLLIEDNGHLWITDFGLAQLPGDASLTLSGDLLGTLRYMSPEQALGKRGLVDQRADVYSLGATLYELATHHPAVTGSDRQDILWQIAEQAPLAPHKLTDRFPRDLETILLKALAKEPSGRYLTAQQLADDLNCFLQGRPVQARRPGPLQHTVMWTRRHRTMVTSVLLTLLLSLIVSVVFIARAYQSERAQRQVAENERAQARVNLQMARSVVDDMYVQVAEIWLKDQPHFTRVQREFLEKAVRFYESLPATATVDAEIRRQMATVQFRVGELRCTMGQFETATAAYQRSISLYDSLVKNGAADREDSVGLANALCRLGTHLITCPNDEFLADHPHDVQTARTALLNARELLTQLVQTDPADREIQKSLATVLSGLSISYRLAKQFDLSEPVAKQAVELMEAALAADDSNADLQITVARTSGEYSEALETLGRNEEAEQAIRRALTLGELALATNPANQQYKAVHVAHLMHLGDLLHARRTDASEIPVLEQGARLCEELSQLFPDVPHYVDDLCHFHSNLISVYETRLRSGDGNPSEDLASAITHGVKLVQARRLAIDTFRLGDPQVREQLVRDLDSLGNLYAEAGRENEMRQAFFLDAPTEMLKVVESRQRDTDVAPEDDDKRFRLFGALSYAGARISAAGDSDAGTKLLERAWSQLSLMRAAPEIEGTDAAGNSLRLSSYRGKVVVLDFFGDWCPACREMYPLERQLVKAYRGRPFALLGVNTDSREVLQQLIEQGEVTWPCWSDGRDGPIGLKWRPPGYPMIYLIDHCGVVRGHQYFAPTEVTEKQQFEMAIEKLVREAESSSLPDLQSLVLDTTDDSSARVVTQQLQHPLSLVARGARWKYLDDGTNPGTSWRDFDFDDSQWNEGNAQLGFGDGDEQTVIGFGGDAQEKCATTYFRHRFDVTAEEQSQSLRLSLVVDDGAVVYLNGQEVARDNVPPEAGQGDYTPREGRDNARFEHLISSPTLHVGPNVLAVVVHQRSPDSSDLSFDLQLTYLGPRNTTVLEFDQLIGNGQSAVPLGAIVSDAKLILSGANALPDCDLQHVVGSGLSQEIAIPKMTPAAAGTHEFDVTDSLRQWTTGQANKGWAMLTNDDGETDNGVLSSLHARLVIRFWPPPDPKRSNDGPR